MELWILRCYATLPKRETPINLRDYLVKVLCVKIIVNLTIVGI